MLDVRATFRHDDKQSFSVSVGLNRKGGMDDDDFFEYIKKSIMRMYPNTAHVKGRWVCIKCDSGPGRLNMELLAYLQFHGFLLFYGVPEKFCVTSH